jgi:folate-binding protein YgfZ
MSQESLYLENKKILTVSGLNCVEFLNNILTSDISKLTPLETIPAALLSPQGRVLFDLLVSLDFRNYSKKKSILIEYDLFCEDDLIKKLNIYNLRREVKVEKTNYNVFVTINPKSFKNSLKDKRFLNANVNINRIYTKNKASDYKNKNNLSNWYDLIRYKYCIPEGTNEIEMNATIPMEINLDLLGGISFEKGCFIGQEVNARIKYKGLVKRKYVPVHFKNKNYSFSNLDKVDNKIFLKTQEIGEVIALLLDEENDMWYGIAKIKLTQLYLFEENNKLECDFFGSKIKINFPNYMLPLPRKI